MRGIDEEYTPILIVLAVIAILAVVGVFASVAGYWS